MRNPIVELLYEVLIQTHRGSVKGVAQRARLAERTVYDQCTDGRLNPSVEVIRAAFEETGDPRLKALLEPKGWHLVPRQPAQAPTQDWERELGDVHLAAAALQHEVRQGLEGDNRLDRHELVAVRRRLSELRHQIDEVEDLADGQMESRPPLRVADGD
jgi:hypothetical protein